MNSSVYFTFCLISTMCGIEASGKQWLKCKRAPFFHLQFRTQGVFHLIFSNEDGNNKANKFHNIAFLLLFREQRWSCLPSSDRIMVDLQTLWSRKTTSRSHSGPHGTASGCQGKNWSPPWQQAAVETFTWPASPSVDATTGSRHRTRRWCRIGHSQWSSSMEDTTTHRRSMVQWMNEIQTFT